MTRCHRRTRTIEMLAPQFFSVEFSSAKCPSGHLPSRPETLSAPGDQPDPSLPRIKADSTLPRTRLPQTPAVPPPLPPRKGALGGMAGPTHDDGTGVHPEVPGPTTFHSLDRRLAVG